MKQKNHLSRGASRIGLILIIVAFVSLLLVLVGLFTSGIVKRRYGLGPEFTMEMLIISIGVMLLFFFLVCLPLLMVIGYQGARKEALEKKIKEDLWLCGLDDKQLNTKLKAFAVRNSWNAFILPATVNLVFIFVMWGVVFFPEGISGFSESIMGKSIGAGYYSPDIKALFKAMASNASPVTWAFLGAYFYTITLLIRRWLQADLTTGVLWKINVRVAVTLIVGLLLTKVMPDIPIIFFLAGIVPDTIIRWLTEKAKRAINFEGEGFSKLFKPSELQEKIDGLSFWQADRLFEEGIESIQDLSMKEIPDLLISTRFDTPHLLYWVDQALLCNQVGGDIEVFKNAYIRTASNLLDLDKTKSLQNVWKSLHSEPDVTSTGSNTEPSPVIKGNIPLQKLENAILSIKNGPNIPYVQEYWRNTNSPKRRADKLAEIPSGMAD
jgi:hypothetical protein